MNPPAIVRMYKNGEILKFQFWVFKISGGYIFTQIEFRDEKSCCEIFYIQFKTLKNY